MYNPAKFFRNRKVGLALGSGGAKGLSHISVIEYLEGLDIPVDMISGSSIGAVVGAVYLCGNLKRLKKDMLSFSKKELLSVADITLPKSGLVKGKGFTEFMKRYIPPEAVIEDLPKPLAIVATDYYTGRPVILKKGRILDALRASVSIPGVFIPVQRDDTFYIDGGVANPLPVDVVKSMGAGLTVAVNLHPGLKISKIKKYVKSKAAKIGINIFTGVTADHDNNSNPDGLKRKNIRWLKKVKKSEPVYSEKIAYPSIFEVLFQAIDIMEYVNTQNNLKYHSPTVLIEPGLLHTGTLDFFNAKEIIDAGFAASELKRTELKRKIKLWI
jgi:NTE family protein